MVWPINNYGYSRPGRIHDVTQMRVATQSPRAALHQQHQLISSCSSLCFHCFTFVQCDKFPPVSSTMSEFKDRITDVLDFWFGKPGEADYLQSKRFWYGSPEDDELVRRELSADYERARSGKLESWTDTVEGSIALIILLDQVPRNIFRDKAQAYATDDMALEVARKVVERGWDKDQPTVIRRYIYSPFNHSENLDDQKRSVELFTELGDGDHLYWAKNFYDIILAHGRFPHRDRILGRTGRRTK